MLRYRRLQIFVAAALTFVLVVGLAGELPPRHENFPFASWSLFSLVPGRRSEFDLILHAKGDPPPGTGRPFNQAKGLVYHPHSIVAHEVIQQLGDAEQHAHADASRTLRRQIELDFVPAVKRYDLVRVTYTPVERWRTGRVLASATVRSFETGEP